MEDKTSLAPVEGQAKAEDVSLKPEPRENGEAALDALAHEIKPDPNAPAPELTEADKAAAAASTIRIEVDSEEPPGTVIGRYKLLQKIGEGGMGVVYMAEQEEPVRRRVALKIIKLGMDTSLDFHGKGLN